jgi:hypothetical protein
VACAAAGPAKRKVPNNKAIAAAIVFSPRRIGPSHVP